MNNLRIIEGKNVDLITPFPLSEVHRTYGWMHCYRTLTESDDSPKTMDGMIELIANGLQTSISWGIVDKNHLTNIKHEAPLVGIITFDPIFGSPGNGVVRAGLFHVATARKAWKTGLVDEAGQLVLRELFEGIPTLLRVGGFMLEKNAPAKSLCRRLGFKFEGVVEDILVQNGSPQSMVLFGLTRRNYTLCQEHSNPLEAQLVASPEESLEKVDQPIPPTVPQI